MKIDDFCVLMVLIIFVFVIISICMDLMILTYLFILEQLSFLGLQLLYYHLEKNKKEQQDE